MNSNGIASWSRPKLAEICEQIDYGFTASASSVALGPRFLRITDIQDGSVDWNQVPFAATSDRDVEQYALRPGDIVFARTGATTGKSFLIRSCPDKAIFASYLIRIRPQAYIDSRYLAYFFDTPDYWSQIRREAQGAGQPGVNASKLQGLSVPLPALSEQKRIADVLDAADAIRRKRKAATDAASNLSTSIFQEYFGQPLTDCNRWKIVEFGQLFAIPPNYGTMVVPSDLRHAWLDLRVANIQNGELDLSERKYVELEPEMIPRHEVQRGDLLLARAIGSIEHLGKCFIANPAGEKWAFDSHLMRVRFDRKKVEPRYVHSFLTTPSGRREFLRNARRSAVQFNINTKELAKIRIPLPPLTEQREFVTALEKLDALVNRQREATKAAESLFESLSYRAFQGKL